MPRDYENKSPSAFQRLSEYKREDGWIRAFLRDAKVGHIASAQDDKPFLNPTTFWFDEEKNRTVAVHSAAILEALRKVYGAESLVKEMQR